MILLDVLLLIQPVLCTFNCTVREIVSGFKNEYVHVFFLSLGCQNKWHPSHMAVNLWRHSARLLMTIHCVYSSPCELHTVWLSVRSVSTFSALKYTGHESFLSTWRHSRTWPKTTTSSSEHRARGITMTSLGMQGHCHFPGCPRLPPFSLISASACPCPRAEGLERWAGVTETQSPVDTRPRGKEEQMIYTMFTTLLYVETYGFTRCKADLEPRTIIHLTEQWVVYKASLYF